jgi:hypothetical protein
MDVPEILIVVLMTVLVWVGGRDWINRHRHR